MLKRVKVAGIPVILLLSVLSYLLLFISIPIVRARSIPQLSAEGQLGRLSIQTAMETYPGDGLGIPFYPGDEKWETVFDQQDQRFFVTGTANVSALAVLGNDLYVGGSFEIAGENPVSNLARWDGQKWWNIDGGVNGYVSSIASNGSDLYVAGSFTKAGGQAVGYVARWNGSTWDTMGGGVNGPVASIAVNGDDVYIGGDFSQAGSLVVNHIAHWNGTAWEGMGGGFDSYVNNISVMGTDVFAVGDFSRAGSVNANQIAHWTGSTWEQVGEGVTGYPSQIAVIGTQVFVGGSFSYDGVFTTILASWNGSNWTNLQSELLAGEPYGSILSMIVNGTNLYVSGSFQQGGKIARWDGSQWAFLDNGIQLPNSIYALAVAEENLFIGGYFSSVDGVAANSIYHWNGTAWTPLGKGLISTWDGSAESMITVGGEAYIGGDFEFAGGQPAKNIVKWDGQNWQEVGGGVSGTVDVLASDGIGLYVGGYLSQAGTKTVSNIAYWNGTSWSDLGGGVDSSVSAIAMSGKDLFVAGNFTKAGGQDIPGVARWDGSTWHSLGSGIQSSFPFVEVVVVDGENIFIGGSFTQVGGKTVHNIARWDGTAWNDVGGGVSGSVDKMVILGNDLYVSGIFSSAGGQPANQIARWDGTAWHTLGNGFPSSDCYYCGMVYSMTVVGSDLYVGGQFWNSPTSDPSPYSFSNGIARWDGSHWWNLGTGLWGPGGLIASDEQNQVYVAGRFPVAGNKPSFGFSIYHPSPEAVSSYEAGAPGSTFTLNGSYFPANSPVSIIINGVTLSQVSQPSSLSSLTTDKYGAFSINLSTGSNAKAGTYHVTLQTNPSNQVAITYKLDPGQAVRPGDGTSPTISVPESLVPLGTQSLFLPLITH